MLVLAEQANSSVEKAGILASVPMRLLPTDEYGQLRGCTVQAAIEADNDKGLIPCYVSTVAIYLFTTVLCVYVCLHPMHPSAMCE